jgi:hypothetical protein
MAKAKKTSDVKAATDKPTKETSRAPKKAATKKAEAVKAPAKGPAKAKVAAPAKAAKPAAKAAVAKKTTPVARTTAAAPVKAKAVSTANGAAEKKSAISAEEFRAVEQDSRELPLEYGDTKIVLMSRDPEWVFAYWEINADSRKKFGLVKGRHNKPLTLRVHELKGGKSLGYFDVTVNDYTSSWYLKIPNTSSSYRVDLGLVQDGGKFDTIAASNVLTIPRLGISEESSVEFAEINDEIYTQIVQLSGGYHISERLGSDEFLRSLQQRVFQSLTAGPLSSAGLSSGSLYGLSSGLLSSGMFSGSFLASGAGFSGDLFSAPGGGGETTLKRPAKESDFWLEVGVDVIVYGATVPDAKVRFMGQEVRLTPDGTFRVRMVLPDTTIEFPVDATSADGTHRRAVKPVVTRNTEGDPHKPL